MNLFLKIVLTSLTEPPGNIVFHLVVAFSIVAALLAAINLWQKSQFPQVKRAILGLVILLGLQVVLFMVSILASMGLLDGANVLPPLDRAVTLLALIWIAWLWIFPEPFRAADAATLLLSALALVFLGLTVIAWPQTGSTGLLSHTLLNLTWQTICLAFVVFAIVALSVRQPNSWGYGLAMLILAFLGHAATILLGDQGSFPGAVRFAQIAMYPILLSLAQRFPAQDLSYRPPVVEKPRKAEKPPKAEKGKKSAKIEKVEKVEKTAKTEPVLLPAPIVEEKRRYSTDAKTLHALLALAAETQPDKIANALTRSVAQVTLADLAFLVVPSGQKDLAIACGYDLIREENLGGAALAGDAVPMLATAVLRGRPLRLPASSTSTDLKGLGQALGLGNAGHLLSIPVISPERGPVGALLLLSPYSNRLWSAEDQGFLSNVAPLFVPILERSQKIAALEHERNTSNELVEVARKKYEEAVAQSESARQAETQVKQQAENIATLRANQEEAQKLVEQMKAELLQMQAENENLRKSGGTGAVSGQIEHELRLALEENAHLQNTLADANIRILEMEQRPVASISGDQAEVVASLSQELRQPMSSIVGYTDLLLGESVGILGALQRKFIERIKASTERIGGLVDDLIQITTLEAAHVEMKPEAVDLNLIIDNAVAYTSTQIREKNITLQLDTPETPPQVQTDREALQQILIHLLQNAGAATPAEGTIGLQLDLQQQDDREYLQIQVTDSGGGIAPEDIEKVFQRRYRADHTLIQGLGDTSVGLSIAKSLVDAQNGRIWVDSKPGSGATFSVLLPVQRTEPLEES